MTPQARQTLKPKCGCMMKGYPDRQTAERALARIQGRALRSVMPSRIVECWQGQWHVVGASQNADTGPDRNTRALVIERDVWACAACGRPMDLGPWSIQHRVARGAGGTSDPSINSPANLLVLCGSATSPGGCHAHAESRDSLMHALGFWLRSGQDPAETPVFHAAYGWVLLAEDGGAIPIPDGAA